MKWVFQLQDLQMFDVIIKHIWVIFITWNGSETQFQVGENVNYNNLAL